MIIENIKWREVIAKHITTKKEYAGKIEMMADAYISLVDDRLEIQETGQMSYNRSWMFTNSKLVKLTSNEIEIDTEWWGSTYPKKGPAIRHPNHKVKITAKF